MTKSITVEPNEIGYLKIETHRSGPFVFQIGTDKAVLESLKARVTDAYTRFISAPMLGRLADDMENLVLVSAVYSTNSIEGADLTENETAKVMQLLADQIQNEAQKRVRNLKEAFEYIDNLISKIYTEEATLLTKVLEEKLWWNVDGSVTVPISESLIKGLHKIVCKDLTNPVHNIPGQYRNDLKGVGPTVVGDEAHGGRYVPPKAYDDVVILMQAFVTWANSAVIMSLPAICRAPLIHYYFERIHPFADGNGRVGRLLETFILQASGCKYVAKAISGFYLKNIDKYYVLFNQCRKAAEKHEESPNTYFVKFFLEGMLHSINRLQDKANMLIAHLLDVQILYRLERERQINTRQLQILRELLKNEILRDKQKLINEPWYNLLYKKRSERTKMRDLKELIDLNLIAINANGKISLNHFEPALKLEGHPLTSP